jgi:multisubunit Na+/H+ antiporter MnhB subunit
MQTYWLVNQRAINILIIGLVSVLTVLLIVAFIEQPVHDNALRTLALDNIEKTGVSNPVTAVLLNYRAYDTYMEFAVFLCVAVAVVPYVLDAQVSVHKPSSESQVLSIAKVFVPLSIIMGGYLLWIGSSQPGGAFQASSLLAGCLVLLSLANVKTIDFSKLRIRLLLSSGLLAFVAVITLSFFQTQGFIILQPAFAGALILFVEFFATFAISVTLFLCFESIHKGHL